MRFYDCTFYYMLRILEFDCCYLHLNAMLRFVSLSDPVGALLPLVNHSSSEYASY